MLVDTSIWIDHSRSRDTILVDLLRNGEVTIHEFIIGELAIGTMPNRSATMDFLSGIRRVPTMPAETMLDMVERLRLFGIGIGFVDAHLLCSALATGETLWTRDKRLARVAARLGISADAG